MLINYDIIRTPVDIKYSRNNTPASLILELGYATIKGHQTLIGKVNYTEFHEIIETLRRKELITAEAFHKFADEIKVLEDRF